MKSALERQMSEVSSRAELHRVIDELPEGAEALLLVNKHDEGAEYVKMNVGTWADIVYYLEYFKLNILNGDVVCRKNFGEE